MPNFYSFRARYYDPVVGRFLSEDPTDIGSGENLYAYVDNDPLSLRDPTGLQGQGGLPANLLPIQRPPRASALRSPFLICIKTRNQF
jgi:uncharacterized protein RhaS with RHS repeats